MAHCLIGLGSNQGARCELLDRAVESLAGLPEVKLVARSAWHEFPPVGGPPGQAAYLNGAVLVETTLGPEVLLHAVHRIEAQLGRRRSQRWGPRPIDIDLLLFDDMVCDAAELTLPHPRMSWRRFVLQPAAEVAAEMVHPQIGWTVARLLEHLDTTVPYVAVTGGIGAGKGVLAGEVARRCGSRLLLGTPKPRQLEAFYADPASHAWQTELEFLEKRTAMLGRRCFRSPAADESCISNFWFDQSLAFARVWLSAEQFARFEHHWRKARQEVCRPRLIVLLDLPIRAATARVRRRGRPGEVQLSCGRLEEIRQAIRGEALKPGKGPVLVWRTEDLAGACQEVLAAVEAMR